MPEKPLTLLQVEELLMMSADLVDELGEDYLPLLDYWERKYTAKKSASCARERIRMLLADNSDHGTRLQAQSA